MGNSYRETELLTEHFGFLPISIIDDIINVNNDRFKILLDFSFDFLLIFAQGG